MTRNQNSGNGETTVSIKERMARIELYEALLKLGAEEPLIEGIPSRFHRAMVDEIKEFDGKTPLESFVTRVFVADEGLIEAMGQNPATIAFAF